MNGEIQVSDRPQHRWVSWMGKVASFVLSQHTERLHFSSPHTLVQQTRLSMRSLGYMHAVKSAHAMLCGGRRADIVVAAAAAAGAITAGAGEAVEGAQHAGLLPVDVCHYAVALPSLLQPHVVAAASGGGARLWPCEEARGAGRAQAAASGLPALLLRPHAILCSQLRCLCIKGSLNAQERRWGQLWRLTRCLL